MPSPSLPHGLRLSLDPAPTLETRNTLWQEINAHNARTVAQDTRRFALLLHDGEGKLVAGLGGALSWQWLFVDALWVSDAWRGHGLGRALLERAEAHALAEGCHSAWLDTFQAREFYLARGYQEFGTLEDYPPGQTRSFLRKKLAP